MALATRPFDTTKYLADEADRYRRVHADCMRSRARRASAASASQGLQRGGNTMLAVLDELRIELPAKPKAHAQTMRLRSPSSLGDRI